MSCVRNRRPWQNWNFTIEHEMFGGFAVEAAYTGSKGTHLGRSCDINQPIHSESARLPSGLLARPVPVFNSINQFVFNASSIYHAGIFSLRKRFAHGGLA